MSESPRYTSIRDYLRVLREQRLIIIFITVAFVALSIVGSLRQEPVYEASASLNFSGERADFSAIGASAPTTESPEQRAATYAQRIGSIEVAERAAESLDIDVTAATLLGAVDIQAEARTHFVVVTAQSGSASLSAAVANAFADAARTITNRRVRAELRAQADAVRRQNRELSSNNPDNTFTRSSNIDRIARLETLARFATPAAVVVEASPPGEPVSPQPIRNAILGLLVGLTIALLVAFLRDALDRRFKSVSEIKHDLKMPMVGHVRDELLGRSVLSTNGRGPLSAAELEAFRILRTNVDFLDVDQQVKSIVVTSALPEEGKSTVAVALAAAYATAGRRALIVDCDLRRPTMASRLGLNPSPGLSDFLIGRAEPQDVLQTVALDAPVTGSKNGDDGERPTAPLVCVTAGTPTPQPAELLGSERFKRFLEQVSDVYDIVVIDSSPLLSVVDTLELVPNVDGIVFCVRASSTTRDQARAARQALEHFPPRPTGVVVTGVRPGDETDYGYYSYAYAYGDRR